MPSNDMVELEGVVKVMPGGGFYKVEVNENFSVLAQLCGKMKQHKIKVIVGDKVKVEVSPHDLTRGRITFRVR